MASKYHSLPSVDRILSDTRIEQLSELYSRKAIVDLVRQQLSECRNGIRSGINSPTFEQIIESVLTTASSLWKSWPIPVINATGVILHTNLGRAPLSSESMQYLDMAARGYTNLEFDLETGKRGSRQEHISRLVSQVTGSESALVTNNNAFGVLLGLTTLAKGKEVIVSRGEAVEIGGGFRIPEILAQSGASLVEVGTTNRTYVADFENAVNSKTGVILSVHPSNFKVSGFTHTPEIRELAKLGQAHNIPVLHDLGSGCLIDSSTFGLSKEPMPQDSIAAGVDLVFFSGDKLLGGPQSGIIAGTNNYISEIKAHPLARAIRVDKLNMAALTATLVHYIKDEALEKIPVWRMISLDTESIRLRARKWQQSIGSTASLEPSVSTIGGGSLPGETLPTWTVQINTMSLIDGVNNIANRIRNSNPPVLTRIEDEHLVLDPRTVQDHEDDDLLRVVKGALEA
ncbi:MAG: L-seryl-tRNA(Sec) selenium transferase [Chloroflexota bacterium]|nr:L-seryl-tRNA(Sec) selenium transferase [Chloroflexota bacterium]